MEKQGKWGIKWLSEHAGGSRQEQESRETICAKTQESCNTNEEGKNKTKNPTKIGPLYTASTLGHPNACLQQCSH